MESRLGWATRCRTPDQIRWKPSLERGKGGTKTRTRMIRHIQTNIEPWGPDKNLQNLDDCLHISGSTAIRLPFETFEMESDGDHFTRRGYLQFVASLACQLPKGEEILILADSTVDFHNWSDVSEWTGWASETMRSGLAPRTVLVDAICGSGFVSRAAMGEHFYLRLSAHYRRGFRGSVLFVGGWNDVRAGRTKQACDAVTACCSLPDRYC